MYEIHITVNTREIDSFKEACKKIGVKPIIIDLQDKTGNTVFHDVMTSSTYSGSSNVFEEVCRIEKGLEKQGFKRIRLKIECSPFHNSVPTRINKLKISDDNYFESHIRVLTEESRINELRKVCGEKAHVSRNLFKKLENKVQILLTIRRDIGVYEDFKSSVDEVVNILNDQKFITDKIEVEYVLYDSNKNHDLKWILS